LVAFAVGLALSAPAVASGTGVGRLPQGSSPHGSYLRGVAFVTALHGWVVGPAGAIWVTTDDGSTWSRQKSGTAQDLRAVTFKDASRGWVVGADGTILATTNGGARWSAQLSGTTQPLDAVSFADAGHGWAVGAGGTILATSDGGATWSTQPSGGQPAGTTGSLSSVSFCDASHGWAAGAGGTLLATSDGGATWSTQLSDTTASLSSVSFRDASHGWAVGSGGTIVNTTNGGATWSAQPSGTSESLNAVSFCSSSHGWAAGARGTILATTNGGATWHKQTSGTTQPLDALAFLGAGRGWAAGGNGTILATRNGGATWRTAPPKPAIIRQLIAFGAKRRAETVVYNRRHYGQATWRLTPKVIVLHYTDGGTEAGTHATFNADRPDLGVLPGVVAHFVIDRNGRIYQQLPLNIRGRHTVGLNYVAVGIEFVQDGRPNPTWATNQIFHRKAQIGAGVRLVRWLLWRYEIKPGNIVGHGTANASPYYKDLLHWRNTHVDWLAPAVRRFRALLGG